MSAWSNKPRRSICGPHMSRASSMVRPWFRSVRPHQGDQCSANNKVGCRGTNRDRGNQMASAPGRLVSAPRLTQRLAPGHSPALFTDADILECAARDFRAQRLDVDAAQLGGFLKADDGIEPVWIVFLHCGLRSPNVHTLPLRRKSL